MYSLLLLSSLLLITTCTDYTVTPDDHYYPNTTCHHCHNLQHYLLNITEYFTSNTQLLFLPGLHHLHTDLIMQNIHNISLIGSTVNGTPNTIIKVQLQTCVKCISMINITKLTIRNIIFAPYSLIKLALLYIHNSAFVSLNHLIIYHHRREFKYYALVISNIMGNSFLNHVRCFGVIEVIYNETYTHRERHSLSMNNCRVYAVYLCMSQTSYKVTLTIINIQVQHNLFTYPSFILAEELGTNEVLMINCQLFDSNIISYRSQLLLFSSTGNGSVQFTNCHFINNIYANNIFGILGKHIIRLYESIQVEFNNCYFYGYFVDEILRSYGNSVNPINVVVRNTVYTVSMFGINDRKSVLLLSNTTLILVDSVSFQNITEAYRIISLRGNSTIIISGRVKLSHNHVDVLIDLSDNNIQYIIIKENSVLNISHNEARLLFDTNLPISKYPFPFCFFQYFTSCSSKIEMDKIHFLIRFHDNQYNYENLRNYYDSIPTTNCLWLENSLFNNNIPLEVNNHYLQFINNSGTYNISQLTEQSSLCVCTDELHYDCHINQLGYSYPGQTLTVFLYHREADTANVIVVKTDIYQQYVTPCIVLNISENLQYISKQCVRLHYTIGFSTDNWCELFLKTASDSDEYLNIFYIKQMTCPTGFVKIDKRCQCDPVLVQYGITNCNINDQTILPPANSWISATTHNNSYTYHISLQCPFHYCLPHSSHLNFSNSNSQCQFNRSEILCGHCQQGLSTVFSSFQCQHCSSIYLLIIIPIAIAGLALVLMLFVLNLTVTDGTINGFILYANIISINTPVIFTELNHFTPTYTFISLANLDLGIQTCFYNGMDDYAKMWLQLAFPFYLIFIATLIIITSRYSTTIQRLTARRVLPVLATLFLLSYTKILRIVSSVLFFYSTITHLPSKHTTLVWSVDANVPLFGVRFTILFIVCLILFLILVPFNIILLFTRTLARFRFISRFKPLLDAYQGPYKDKFYYWTGLQLLMRAVFFGISSLDRNINIAITILLLSVMIGLHGVMRPFKIKHKNYQEILLFFNLQGLFVILSYSQGIANSTAINIMIAVAAIHFGFIITYHIIIYVYGGVLRNKIWLNVNTFREWITRLHKKLQPQQFQLRESIRDNIPEAAFNYHEYREPLVGVDC